MLNEKADGHAALITTKSILSTMHVHRGSPNNYLEVIVVKGKAKNVQRIADGLISTKGVKHGYLTL